MTKKDADYVDTQVNYLINITAKEKKQKTNQYYCNVPFPVQANFA